MNIIDEQEFNLKPNSNNDDSQIFINGKKTGCIINGTCLELCVKRDDQFLVFVTDNIPNEDMLHIYLLDNRLDVLDSVIIGSIYSTGSFKNQTIKGRNTIIFNFIGGNKWTVTLLENKEFRIPFVSSIKGVSRKHLFSQHFRVSGDPQPEV